MKRPRPKQPGGFTLIELLVVIAIIAILIGLLIPAVQKVRDSALRTTCTNNLHQLGIAVHGYHDANLALPPGRAGYSGGVTWVVLILPYIEQGNFFYEWDPKKLYYAHPADIRKTQVSTLFCPARRTVDPSNVSTQGDVPENWSAYVNPPVAPDNGGGSFFGATGDYAVCDGDNQGSATYNTPDANGSIIFGTTYYAGSPPQTITSFTSSTNFSSITDGLSNTILIGEKHVRMKKFGLESEGDGSIYNGDPANINAARIAGPSNLLAGSPRDSFNTQFGSYHQGLCQFVLADGSVRPVNNNASGLLLSRLAVRNDGQEVPDY